MPVISHPDNDGGDGWQYDDYALAEDYGAQAASGSLELITVGDTQYIHAKSVGSGTITTSEGTEEITVEKAKLDAVFMYGQSNAAYRNAVPSEADPVPEIGTAYYFGLEDRSGPNASENNTGMDITSCKFWSMSDDNGDLRIGDKGPAFAATYYNNTGHKVYWINGAIGNKSMQQFLPGAFMWEYGEDILTAAMDAVDTDCFDLTIHNYMWIQGEANSSTDTTQYKQWFLQMHGALLHGDMGGYAFEDCYMSKVRSTNGVNSSEAQIELSEEYPSIIMATDISDTFTVSNGLMGSDDLHYSQLGNNLIGEALAESMAPGESGANEATYTLLGIIPIVIIAALIGVVVLTTISRRE